MEAPRDRDKRLAKNDLIAGAVSRSSCIEDPLEEVSHFAQVQEGGWHSRR